MPLYITHNYWLLVFLTAAPLLIFLGRRSMGLALFRTLVACAVGWVVLNLAVDRHWDLRIAYLPPDASEEEMLAATADGANRVFTFLFGWVPSGLYAAFWLLMWLGIGAFLRWRAPRTEARAGIMEESEP